MRIRVLFGMLKQLLTTTLIGTGVLLSSSITSEAQVRKSTRDLPRARVIPASRTPLATANHFRRLPSNFRRLPSSRFSSRQGRASYISPNRPNPRFRHNTNPMVMRRYTPFRTPTQPHHDIRRYYRR